MFDKNLFDPAKVAEMFNVNEFSKFFESAKFPGVDANALMESQKKNLDALVEANKAAASGYQELFSKQVKVFEETMAEAQKQVTSFDPSKSAEAAQAQTEVVKAAFEKAVANMTELAEGAKKANSEAYEIMSKRVQASMKELQDLTAKFSV